MSLPRSIKSLEKIMMIKFSKVSNKEEEKLAIKFTAFLKINFLLFYVKSVAQKRDVIIRSIAKL